jgi:hypothetical protein
MSTNPKNNKSASKASAQTLPVSGKPTASKNLGSPGKDARVVESKGTPGRQSESAPVSKKGGATLKVSNSQASIILAGEKKRGKIKN